MEFSLILIAPIISIKMKQVDFLKIKVVLKMYVKVFEKL